MLLEMHVGGSHFDGLLTILNFVAEETELLLPGSKIIIGRMHVQHPKFTKFGKKGYSLHALYKDSNLYFSPERKHRNHQLTKRLI